MLAATDGSKGNKRWPKWVIRPADFAGAKNLNSFSLIRVINFPKSVCDLVVGALD